MTDRPNSTYYFHPSSDAKKKTHFPLSTKNLLFSGACIAEDLHGLDTLENDVYVTPEIVEHTHKAGLLFACYGDNVGDNLPLMRKLGVDIAIYDRYG